MRRKIEKEDGFQEAELIEKWSKKRLAAALAILLVLGGLGYFALNSIGDKARQVLGEGSNPKVIDNTAVKGAETSEDVRLPTKDDVSKVLEDVKSQLNNITSDNITASQAAVQKIIEDLQSVQSGSQSPVGAFCDLVCKKN